MALALAIKVKLAKAKANYDTDRETVLKYAKKAALTKACGIIYRTTRVKAANTKHNYENYQLLLFSIFF